MSLLNRPRAERVLDGAGLDGLLATSVENVYYLTHVWVESQIGLPRQAQFYAAVARSRLDAPAIACGINEMGNVLANAPAGSALVPYGKFYRFVEPAPSWASWSTGSRSGSSTASRSPAPVPGPPSPRRWTASAWAAGASATTSGAS